MTSDARLPEVTNKDLIIWDDHHAQCCGYLNKKASKSSAFSAGKWQKRWFFINIDLESTENYSLAYSYSPDDNRPKQAFPLSNAALKLSDGASLVLTCFDDTVLTVSADNKEIRKKWYDTLQNVITVASLRERVIQELEGNLSESENNRRLGNSAGIGGNSDNSMAHHKSAYIKAPTASGGIGGGSAGDGNKKSNQPKNNNSSGMNNTLGDSSNHSNLTPTRSPGHNRMMVSGSVLLHGCPALRLDIDANTIPPSSTSRHQFLELFTDDIARTLDIVPEEIEIVSVKPAPGMDWLTQIEFDITPTIPIDEEAVHDPRYLDDAAYEQADLRAKYLYTLYELVGDTQSPLYNGFVTSKLDPSFTLNLIEKTEDREEIVPYSADSEVLQIMELYKDVVVPPNVMDITHFTIELCFEDKRVALKVPNPQIFRKRSCAIWPFEVKKALGFCGTMQELFIDPAALVPIGMPKLLSQPIPFESSVRSGGEILINASRLKADQAYDVQCTDRRDEALNSLSKEEMDVIKETFQKCDINGDGGISRFEMGELVKKRTQERKKIIDDRFEAFAEEPGITEEDIVAAELTKAQLMQQLQEAQIKLLKIFEAADTNNDGLISFTEFIMAEAWWLRCTVNPERVHMF